jgi:hypothetical protein
MSMEMIDTIELAYDINHLYLQYVKKIGCVSKLGL